MSRRSTVATRFQQACSPYEMEQPQVTFILFYRESVEIWGQGLLSEESYMKYCTMQRIYLYCFWNHK